MPRNRTRNHCRSSHIASRPRRVVALAKEAGVMDRLVAVHCDLGRVEWQGTRELAEAQTKHRGIRFEVAAKPDASVGDGFLRS